MHMMKVNSKLFGNTPNKFLQSRGSPSGSPTNSSPTNKNMNPVKMLPLHKLLDSKQNAQNIQQRAFTDRSNNYSNIKSKQNTVGPGKCNFSIVFNENSYSNLGNKVQRKRVNQSPLTNIAPYKNEKPLSIYNQKNEVIPSPKPVQKVCIDLINQAKTCKEHDLKVRFTGDDGNHLCEICAVREAYNGARLMHIKKQVVLQARQNRSYESVELELLPLPKEDAQGDMIEKRQAIQEFLMFISSEKDQTQKRINGLEQLLCTSRLVEYNKTILEDIQLDLASLLKSFLEPVVPSGLAMPAKLAIKENVAQLKTTLADLSLIKSDILSNVQNILTHMDVLPCKQILQKYRQKVDNYRILLNQAATQLCQRFGVQDYQNLKENLILSEESQSTWKETLSLLLKPSKQLNLKLSFGASDDKIIEEPKAKGNKFLNLLEKINSSQSQKNCFLSSIMTSEQNNKVLCLSPQFHKGEGTN